MSEIVLSAAAGNTPEIDGMLRTVMIASQTISATAVVLPARQFVIEDHVARRTHFLAFAAVDAKVAVNGELLVGNHLRVEVGAYHMTQRPGHGPTGGEQLSCQPLHDDLRIQPKLLRGLGYFFPFAFRLVSIHEWQTDVALGHDE